MQILNCSAALGTCCGDSGLVLLLNTTKNILNIIQLVVPIMLIIWTAVDLTKLVINPEDKAGVKKIFNKINAAVIVFLIPVFLNVLMGLMPSSFSLSACFEQAKINSETANQNIKYISPTEEKKKNPILPKPESYEKGVKKETTPVNAGVATGPNGTVRGIDVVNYLKQFKGQGYKLGCHWDGEIPYTPASCIGVVVGAYKHFGIKVPCTEDYDMYLKDPSKFTVVTNGPHRAGDIVIYDGHYAMLTGNGNEIIHSTSSSHGITTSKDYRIGMRLLGIVRVNGVVE